MAELFEVDRATYDCKACGATFAVPRTETPVCCPICRMNRIKRRA